MTAADIAEWDSFNHINLIVATEAKFGIKFQTTEIESLRNVGHFVELIGKKLAASATAAAQKR
jgi:acyl carrier protein